ncbi:MAG: hypothetical protein NZ918_04755 [Aigarchaeota archaeon]|nr:hypothetical protein [Aigarchaeota archaeon]
MILREVFGALRDLGRVHPVDAVAERFITAPPKKAAKQLARDLALLKLLGIGGE